MNTDQVNAEIVSAAHFAWQRIYQDVTMELSRPSVIYRPTFGQDGNAFFFLLGEDLASGISGWGETPEAAARDFDRVWYAKATVPAPGATRQEEP